MNSLILRTTSRFLLILFCQFSVFLLLRGHNDPGGGFVGGLVLAGALTLYVIAYGVSAARRFIRISPRFFIGAGLLLAALSGIVPLLQGEPFMTGRWAHLNLPGVLELDIGTPLIFDVGVYLVVLGATLTVILTLAEEG